MLSGCDLMPGLIVAVGSFSFDGRAGITGNTLKRFKSTLEAILWILGCSESECPHGFIAIHHAFTQLWHATVMRVIHYVPGMVAMLLHLDVYP